MKGLYRNFKTDADLENNGIVLEYGKNSKDAEMEIRIARAGGGNTKFAKLLEQKLKPYRRQMQAGTMDPKRAEQIMAEVYAEAVILGWKNIEDELGNDLPFTRDNVIKVLTDLPDLFADIQEQSQKVALFREEVREADAGN